MSNELEFSQRFGKIVIILLKINIRQISISSVVNNLPKDM